MHCLHLDIVRLKKCVQFPRGICWQSGIWGVKWGKTLDILLYCTTLRCSFKTLVILQKRKLLSFPVTLEQAYMVEIVIAKT